MKMRTHSWKRGTLRNAYVCALAAALAACAGGPPAPQESQSPPLEETASSQHSPQPAAPAVVEAPRAPRLSGGASSEWELAYKVLHALKERDAALLNALRVTEQEYKEHIFPEFPEAKGTIPVDFHWFHLNVRSLNGIEEAIQRFGGLQLELLDVLPTKGVTKYQTYELWNKVELVVEFPDGPIQEIRVFGSLVHMDGVWKILGFPS